MDDFPKYRILAFSFLDGIGDSTLFRVLEMFRLGMEESIAETSAEYRIMQWCLDLGDKGREGQYYESSIRNNRK